jgi:hypothetical protein
MGSRPAFAVDEKDELQRKSRDHSLFNKCQKDALVL